nr:creatininase family protein [Methylomarinum sp. Ch1-1]MDP4519854.1 creatininase family protein [Methylomarinum sp. Ch1-1]
MVLILFYLFGYNLRHSHIWLSYGPFFSKLLISPAQHQIHHSANPTHFDKNFGFIFAIWDALFRSLYIPKQREILLFGLGGHENKQFSSFWSLYLMPFKNLASSFRLSMFLEPKRYLSVLVFLSIVFPSVYLNLRSAKPLEAPGDVFMEDMTWKEIQKAINSGTNTVLIPTGGTEQNGPHMVLGKHNYIVKYTAGKIAEQLGDTLVAPVLTYVPEGTITPPDEHMRFSGTLSVSDKVFSQTLEFTVRSLKQHGFKTIVFIGDSGGNQPMQALVAAKLNALWQKEDIRVLHIDDYYNNNHQIEYLSNHGFSAKQIGGHAGIRDTSELLAIFPDGVRTFALQDYSQSTFLKTGANGDASKANAILGRYLLKLKIEAAVKQIREKSH